MTCLLLAILLDIFFVTGAKNGHLLSSYRRDWITRGWVCGLGDTRGLHRKERA